MIWIAMAREQLHGTIEASSNPLDIRALHQAKNLREHRATFVSTWTRGNSKSSVMLNVLLGRRVLVSYTNAERQAILERIDIEWTPCHFGGERPWWTCPHCGRRCAIVYARGPWPFMCRLCANLTYETSQSDAYTRANCKSNKRRERLGWERGAPFPPKPKGMHWRTWDRLFVEWSRAASVEHASLYALIECSEGRIGYLTQRAAGGRG